MRVPFALIALSLFFHQNAMSQKPCLKEYESLVEAYDGGTGLTTELDCQRLVNEKMSSPIYDLPPLQKDPDSLLLGHYYLETQPTANEHGSSVAVSMNKTLGGMFSGKYRLNIKAANLYMDDTDDSFCRGLPSELELFFKPNDPSLVTQKGPIPVTNKEKQKLGELECKRFSCPDTHETAESSKTNTRITPEDATRDPKCEEKEICTITFGSGIGSGSESVDPCETTVLTFETHRYKEFQPMDLRVTRGDENPLCAANQRKAPTFWTKFWKVIGKLPHYGPFIGKQIVQKVKKGAMERKFKQNPQCNARVLTSHDETEGMLDKTFRNIAGKKTPITQSP